MSYKFDELKRIIERLSAKDGCPWDSVQTFESLKPCCIEEACEVIAGANDATQRKGTENLVEELGDLLLIVMLYAQIGENRNLFSIDDVLDGICSKMIRRHPHVFGNEAAAMAAGVSVDEVKTKWAEIKAQEKAAKKSEEPDLKSAFEEAKQLIDVAKHRKGFL